MSSLPPSPTVSADKHRLRGRLRARRRQLDEADQQRAAEAVLSHIEAFPAWREAATLGAYWPADGELDLRPLMARARQLGKQVLLPVLTPDRRLVFRPWDGARELVPNALGIPEPSEGPEWAPEQLDLLLMPLVGFDRRGGRLGMGGGYYDRSLAGHRAGQGRPLRVGVAHACQEVAEVPLEPWDQRLDAVLTDRGWWLLPSQTSS